MSEKISRYIMIGELIFQLLNFFFIGFDTLQQIHYSYPHFWSAIQSPSYPHTWDRVIVPLLLVAICIGRVSEIILSGVFISGGARRLRNPNPTLWVSTTIGLIISIILFVSTMPPTEGFIDPPPSILIPLNFSYFVLPTFIPFVHLILEKHYRKQPSLAV